MARDLGEQERAFVEALASDTGRDLAAWMTAIAESGHAARNDIIDWLRHQGFNFSNASWLERIHHNGGRLIYADDEALAGGAHEAAKLQTVPETAPPVFPFAGKPPERQSRIKPAPESTATIVLARPAEADAAGVADVLAAAKGLRPLAEVVIGAVKKRVTTAELKSAPPLISFAAPKPFAALLPGAKDLRLYGEFGSSPRVKRAEQNKTFSPPYAQVIVLNDVRQIDEELAKLIEAAHARVNG